MKKMILATAVAAVLSPATVLADVDFDLDGQAVLYYQTVEKGGTTDFFDQGNSAANVGLQINAKGDLGNGVNLGLQGTALSTLGLENNLVSGVMQGAGGDLAGDAGDYFAFTKAHLSKKVGNTTVKVGRQELPKSLSPLAFSEGWNVFRNTFDAIVGINSSVPNTTIVGAYVSRSNQIGDLSKFDKMTANTNALVGKVPVGEGAYMLTVANKTSPVIQPTFTYYALKDVADSTDAIWADVKVNAGVAKIGVQGGIIDPKAGLDNTSAYGLKVGGNLGTVGLNLAYSSVDDGAVAVRNVGTGNKTPLYTQMVANQGNISKDADTVVLQAKTKLGAGTLIGQYGTVDNKAAGGYDSDELDIIYKFKAFGTTMLGAYVRADSDKPNTSAANIIRFWTRYKF